MEAAAQVECEATIDGERAMRASLTFMMKTVESERLHEQRRALYRVWTRSLEAPPVIR